MTQPTRKNLVNLGGFSHEGILATTQVLNLGSIEWKLYGLKPKTWKKKFSQLDDLADDDKIAAIILYLPTATLLQASRDDYRESFSQLLAVMNSVKSIAFIFEPNLSGEFRTRDWKSSELLSADELAARLEAKEEEEEDVSWSEWRDNRLHFALERQREAEARESEIRDFLRGLLESNVPISPFTTRSDVTIRLQEFLRDLDQGVFLRLFVPDARYQSEQLQGLLGLLERYLSRVENRRFSVDLEKTLAGVVYLFRSDEERVNLAEFDEAVGRFDHFMKMCGDDPESAATVLRKKGVPAEEITFLVSKYSRDYRRLLLDVRHEFDHKKLLLQQRLESDLLEISSGASLIKIEQQGPSALLSLANDPAPIEINIGSLSIVSGDQVLTLAEQVINGGIVYNTQDKELLTLFRQYAERLESLQLRSDLDQMKDESSPPPSKMTAKQRIVAFLHRAASKAASVSEKVAVEALSNYLEGLASGKF